MPHYADGFLLPIPKKNIPAYRAMSKKASKIWKDYGAIEYRECVGEDLVNRMGPAFTKVLKTKPGETIILAWIVYKSRAHRDRCNKKIMTDPRIAKMMAGKKMPFDVKRMIYGGFEVIVEI